MIPFPRSTVAVLVLLLAPGPLQANMDDPYRSGVSFGEPSGGLKAVVILRETLAVDLRPLADNGPATVEATYRVRNDGPGQTFAMTFEAPGLDAVKGVRLDGAEVRRAGVDRDVPVTGGVGTTRFHGFEFPLTLPPGGHEIRVRYAARPPAFSGERVTVDWQFAYALKPARSWGGFGGLDVTVELPAGWRYTSAVDFRRRGGTLSRSWEGLPADALRVDVHAPAFPFTGVVALVALVCGGLLVSRLGRAAGRRGVGGVGGGLLAVFLAAAWAAAVPLAAVSELYLVLEPWAGSPQASTNYGYSVVTRIFLISAGLVPAVFVTGVVVAARGIGRGRHAPSGVAPGA